MAITLDPAGPSVAVKAKTKTTLNATSDRSGVMWSWKCPDGTVVAGNTVKIENPTAADAGTYEVTATYAVGAPETAQIEVKLADSVIAPVTDPGGAGPAPAEFHLVFAIVAGVVAALIGGFVAIKVGTAAWGIGKADLIAEKTGATALASALAIPITVVGTLVIAVGVWMAVVEWRGHLVKPSRDRGVDAGAIITAFGKLTGAAQVLAVGAVLLLGSAWIAQSSAGRANGAASVAGPTGPSGPTGPAATP